MVSKQILTITANDQTGLVKQLADCIANAGGNWLESNMSHLAGKFAGIALIEIDPDNLDALTANLNALHKDDLHVTIGDGSAETEEQHGRLLEVEVMAHDRPGIVREITTLFSNMHINVESLHTNRAVAPMSSEHLFEAAAVLILPDSISEEELQKQLETLSDDLMLEIFDLDEEQES